MYEVCRIILLSGIGMQDETDCDNLPPAVPKPSFCALKEVTAKKTDLLVFDLETTGLSKEASLFHLFLCTKSDT